MKTETFLSLLGAKHWSKYFKASRKLCKVMALIVPITQMKRLESCREITLLKIKSDGQLFVDPEFKSSRCLRGRAPDPQELSSEELKIQGRKAYWAFSELSVMGAHDPPVAYSIIIPIFQVVICHTTSQHLEGNMLVRSLGTCGRSCQTLWIKI